MGQCNEGVANVVEQESGAPLLTYFPFAGRGEISRLCAAAGGLKMEQKGLAPGASEIESLAKAHGAIGKGLPVLTHGQLKICQSTAIQNYICAISPRFANMPARCRGVDAMYFADVEDYLADVGKSGIFGELFGGPACDQAALAATIEKWMAHFESRLPATGYINGQPYPTGADCVVFCFYKAAAPWSIFFLKAGVSPDKFTKSQALVSRMASDPGIKAYLTESASLPMNPFAK